MAKISINAQHNCLFYKTCFDILVNPQLFYVSCFYRGTVKEGFLEKRGYFAKISATSMLGQTW